MKKVKVMKKGGRIVVKKADEESEKDARMKELKLLDSKPELNLEDRVRRLELRLEIGRIKG